jgi:L-fuculose-phosphate aldolase
MDQLAVDVAWGSRILAWAGQGDLTLGHVSGRRPAASVMFMKRKGLGLEEVTPSDILQIDLDGRKVRGEGAVHLEVVLHSAVYRARADVSAVIHAHPPYATAFGATDAALEFLTHDSVLFADGVGVFEDDAGLITTAAQGGSIAAALGGRRALLLRNHGVLVVGKSVAWAVLTALTLERAITLQAIARSLGAPRPISAAMATAMMPDKYRDDFVDEYWQYWIRQVRHAGLADGMPSG